MMVTVALHSGRVSASVVKNNIKTVWVSLADGHIINRHKVKHAVITSAPTAIGSESIRVELAWWRRLWAWLIRNLFGGEL